MADIAPMTTAQPPVVTLPRRSTLPTPTPLGEQFAAALTPGVRVVIADMTPTTFCGSAGLNTLIRANKRATATAPNSGCCCPARTSCRL